MSEFRGVIKKRHMALEDRPNEPAQVRAGRKFFTLPGFLQKDEFIHPVEVPVGKLLSIRQMGLWAT